MNQEPETNENADQSDLLSVQDAAKFIHVHPETLRRYAEKGILPANKTVGGHRRYLRSDLECLLEANMNFVSSEAGRREAIEFMTETPKGPDSEPVIEALPFEELGENPLILTCYSPSGGVGKSSTAANLAAYINASAELFAEEKRILVLDGDIFQGSLLLRQGSKLEPSLSDLKPYFEKFFESDESTRDTEGIRKSYDEMSSILFGSSKGKTLNHFVHEFDGMYFLGAPHYANDFKDWTEEDYSNLLDVLGCFYDVIVIDTGVDIEHPSQQAWLKNSDEIFVVTFPDIERLYKMSRTFSKLRDMFAQPNGPTRLENVSVVITNSTVKAGIDLEVVLDHLLPWMRKDQKFLLPDVTKEMLWANSRSEFLIDSHKEYSEAIGELATRAFPNPKDPEASE